MGVNRSYSSRRCSSVQYVYDDAAQKELAEMKALAPDPKNWELIDHREANGNILLKVKYPNCKNNKGVKVMIFATTLAEIVKQKYLDPHFSDENTNVLNLKHHPIARFAPSQWDWAVAVFDSMRRR